MLLLGRLSTQQLEEYNQMTRTPTGEDIDSIQDEEEREVNENVKNEEKKNCEDPVEDDDHDSRDSVDDSISYTEDDDYDSRESVED